MATTEERFIAKVRANEDTGCVEWVGCLDRDGYPQFRVKREDGKWITVQAHRWAFTALRNEPIPEGFELDHLCCNRKCVVHTEPVTPEENKLRIRFPERRTAKLDEMFAAVAAGMTA